MRSLCTMSQEDKDKIKAYKIKHHKIPAPQPKASLVQKAEAPNAEDLQDDNEEVEESLAHIKLKQ